MLVNSELANFLASSLFTSTKDEHADFWRVQRPLAGALHFRMMSILKIFFRNEWERVGGTSMGGGTFWGLGRLLTGCSNFDDLLTLAGKGKRDRVDTLVKDIYGHRS